MGVESPTFAFGQNWADFAQDVREHHVRQAERDLARILPELAAWRQSRPPTFVDIGCGSGLHAVAAARLGAIVQAIDVDEASVHTTSSLASFFGLESKIEIERTSILDSKAEDLGAFDFVYSWGVLHHTGNLSSALDRAAHLLRPEAQSRMALALYRRTRLDWFWIWEKRLYNRSTPLTRRGIELGFGTAWDAARLLRGTSPRAFRRDYGSRRGMSYAHDLRDWLGGYPYEPVSRTELLEWAQSVRLNVVREFVRDAERMPLGLAGSGCDEFVFAMMP